MSFAAAPIGLSVIVQHDFLDEAALVPAVRQRDIGLAAFVDMMIEDNLFDLAVAVNDFDGVELDLGLADLQLEPNELAFVTADVNRVVVTNEADMAVAKIYPVASERGAGGNAESMQKLL